MTSNDDESARPRGRRRILFLCTGNSCRSQMAEGLWRQLAGDRWEPHSAGSRPAGTVHPRSVQAMAEIGIDISGQRSKSVAGFVGQPFDLVVTVCDGAAIDCPSFPGARAVIHWPVDDPASATGLPEEQLAVFRRIRDELKERIAAWLAASRD